MKYPNTPEYLESLPESVVQLYRDLEESILADICRRFRLSGEATETAIEQIRILQRQGLPLADIEQRIKSTLELTDREFDEIFDRAVQRNQEYYDYAIHKADIAADTYRADQMRQQIETIRRQTKADFVNLTQSMGFAIRSGGKTGFFPLAQGYQKVLDDALIQVMSGAADYNTAIRGAVRALCESGIMTQPEEAGWVDYYSKAADGTVTRHWRNRIDVAARRAVMTGITQLSAKYSEQAMEILDTRYVETTAHGGARDKGDDFRNHKKWQGKWYYWSLHGEPDPLGKYPDFVRETGYGDVAGLCGANCRHGYYAVVPGVNEPTYTAGQLRDIDPPPFEYQGKTYTAYEATQKQRQIETRMRELKRRLIGLEASGDNKAYEENAIRLRRLSREYKAFSGAAGLRTQPERARVQGFGTREAAKARRNQ